MRKTIYVRMLVLNRPAKNISVPLAQYAKNRKSEGMIQGRLTRDIRVGEGIRIMVDFEDGYQAREELVTIPVTRLEPGYALTEAALYQFVRVPRSAHFKNQAAGSVHKNDQTILLGTKFVTASQRTVLRELLRMAELCGNQESYGGIKFRARPLIAGFSGAGKSTLIGHLCDELTFKNEKPCPLLRIPAGSWSLINSTHQPYTLNVIRDFVRNQVSQNSTNQKGELHQGAIAVVLLDEIDKITSRGGMAHSWYRNVVGEFISLADADSRLLTSGWTEADISDFQSVLLIAAGAFLDGVPSFADQDQDTHLKAIDVECSLPDEVRRRFNSRILYLEVPNAQDYRDAFERLYCGLNLPLPSNVKLEELVSSAEEAKKGMRFLEEHLAELLIAHPNLRRPRVSFRPRKVVPAPESAHKPEPLPSPKPKSVAKSRYETFSHRFRGLMHELEEPLVLVQALFRAYRGRFKKILIDDPSETKWARASMLDSDILTLLEILRYEYAVDEKRKESLAKEFWPIGCRVLCEVWGAVNFEHQVLMKDGCLPVFAKLQTKLSRLLKAYEHHCSNFREEEE